MRRPQEAPITGEHEEQRWERRPVLSWLLRAFVFLLPVAAGVLAARATADWLPVPAGVRSTVVWWVLVLAAATVALVLVERVARRLLPLAWLLRMSLLFPTRAPRRWRLARRVGSVHSLEAYLAESRASGVDDDDTTAAHRILTLVTALQAHDRRTRGHAERVRVYTDMLTEELGLPVADRDRIRWAALLHDIGKLAISAQLLNKAGSLDDEEWRKLRRHPEEGARFCAPLLAWLGPWGDTIIQHHEKYGGGGYPAGLSGDQIGMGARIVAVPDAYEVMTSPRAYKRAISPRAARKELTDCAGAQFDPAVVRAFLNLSTRRLQWVAGPAAWLAQLPFVNAPTKVSPSTASLGLGLAGIVALALSGGVGPLDVGDITAQEATAAQAGAAGDDAAGTDASDGADDGGLDVAAAPFPPLAPDSGLDPDGDLERDGPDRPDVPGGDGPATSDASGNDTGSGGDDEDDEPIVVILPVPDAPEAPAPDDGATDPDGPGEPDEPVVIIVPAPDPEPTEEPGPIIVIIPPPDPTPTPEPPAPSEPATPTSPSPSPQPDPPASPEPSPAPSPASPSPSPSPTLSPSPSPTPVPSVPPSPPPPPPSPPPPAPPVAVGDSATVERRDSITIDVLGNDGGDLDISTLTVVTQPQHGSASAAGGVVVYLAQPGWGGTVTFTYQVCGVDGACSTATVTVTVVRDGPQQGTIPLPLPLLLGGAALSNLAFRLRRRR